ncbi:unnamed protein product [Nippostrongylus brasiliensis]|uniref:BURP domain-containing protein n=1 Tax=Nippostrongylus brasiliensis TaxID=27835 RepID=A0A0N4YTS2_NIPBR|nr:unnamed protein product [Nippostrongylus brasiliensis]
MGDAVEENGVEVVDGLLSSSSDRREGSIRLPLSLLSQLRELGRSQAVAFASCYSALANQLQSSVRKAFPCIPMAFVYLSTMKNIATTGLSASVVVDVERVVVVARLALSFSTLVHFLLLMTLVPLELSMEEMEMEVRSYS